MIKHLATQELEAGLDHIKQSPKDDGVLEMIVVRPATNERQVLQQGTLSGAGGLSGDRWAATHTIQRPDGSLDAKVQMTQVTIMNSRSIALLSPDADRRPLAGDNLYVDMDLSNDNLHVGQKLSIGTALLEVVSQPHNGCKKFKERFGLDAVTFVNTREGKHLHLRGIYARIVQDGVVTVGDRVTKV